MKSDNKLFQVVVSISQISNDAKLDFDQKLQRILGKIINCVGTGRGSIMLLRGRKSLEVVASTNPDLVGVRQSLDEDSPSAWVIRNKTPLYVDNLNREHTFPKKFDHYKKDSFFSVPIMRNDKVVGVLNVTEKVGEDLITEPEQELLLNISGHMITALENQRLTKALQRSKRNLQKKNLQLRKLEKLKSELFNMLIHDLKGPISELVANLDILSYTVPPENREFVDAAALGCDTLYRMVSNLLDIAKLEEAKLKLIYGKIDPKALIKESLARLSGLAKIRDLRFVETSSPEEAKGSLHADRAILLRVMHNLLANAMKHSPSGGTIEIGFVYPEPAKVTFFVEDNGSGIAEEYREAIFDKYVQVENKEVDRGYSTGLGLTFCKMAVEAHKGSIRVESTDGKGSRFSFSLPLTS